MALAVTATRDVPRGATAVTGRTTPKVLLRFGVPGGIREVGRLALHGVFPRRLAHLSPAPRPTAFRP